MKKSSMTHKATTAAKSEAEPNEQPRTVFLEEVGPNKIQVIKALREVTGLGLAECKNLLDSTDPRVIKEDATRDEVEAIRKKFVEVGATIGADYAISETFGPTVAPKPETKTPDPEINPAATRRKEFEQRALKLKEASAEFGAIDEYNMAAVLALIDLFTIRDVNEGLGNSWLSQFVYEVLMNIVYSGIDAVENDPESVLRTYADKMHVFQDELPYFREIAARYAEFKPARQMAEIMSAAREENGHLTWR